MIIYRLEHKVTSAGMWYRADGSFDPIICSLTDGISAGLPMEFDERYGAQEKRWLSGCPSIDVLRSWFSDRDVFELVDAGYGLFEFSVNEYVVEEMQTLFTREGIQSVKPLDWHSVLGGINA